MLVHRPQSTWMIGASRNLSTAGSSRIGSAKYTSRSAALDLHQNEAKNKNYPSLILQGHGLSKTTIESLRPLPEKAEEPSPHHSTIQQHTLPGYGSTAFGHQVPPRLRGLSVESDEESFISEDKLSISDASSLGTIRSSSSFGSIQSVRTLGNTSTGRSSVYSWGNDDEFDKQAANKVWDIFEDVDQCLFQNSIKEGQGDPMKEECFDWKSSFKYIRVTGRQLTPDHEEGTQIIPTALPTSHRNSDIDEDDDILSVNDGFYGDDEIESDTTSLGVYGNKAGILLDSEDVLPHLNEEVFAQHGQVEEFFAFDEKTIETSRDSCKDMKMKRRAIPPITPQALARDMALSECFDHVWSQAVKTLSDLLKLYIKARSVDRENKYSNVRDDLLESALTLHGTHDPYKMPPQLHSQMKMKPDLSDLKDVMTIRSVSLKQRAPSTSMYRHEDDGQSRLGTSSSTMTQKTFGGKTSSLLYDRMMSAKTPKRTIRLQPLQPPKTAGHVDSNIGEIRGTRLSNVTVGNGQQSWVARNGTLPPLDRLGTTEELRKSPKRNTRASSAVNAPSKHSSQRDRGGGGISMLPDSRPNTNHSYRSDVRTPHQFNRPASRSRDFPVNKLYGQSHPQTINENSYLRISSHFRNDPPNQQEVDDFVLWGHGPPLISHQQRRGKTANQR
ncbi:protein FAM149A-like isoform X2 [Clytia hemisphaerica]|uniref:DUF3719 domain-containing protein n=1 Tax=Clytia hemisphaerica TaxID=252671 RepID=A0A7M5WIY0_9CNID